jgi:hypothetical protein
MLLVDGLGRVNLLHNTENTVVKMLIKVLSISESDRASGASALGWVERGGTRSLLSRWALSSAIGRRLLDSVDRSKMALEDVGAVEALLGRGARPGAEAAHHRTLVVGQCVAVLVVLASESLDVVLACLDRALLWPLILVREHMGLEILEDTAAFGNRA